jgi:hypothetical protein
VVGSGREFDESKAADTTGESAEKEYSFERKEVEYTKQKGKVGV